jgi:hypothetical protein
MKESGFQPALLRLASISHYNFLLLVRLKSFSGKDFTVYVPPSAWHLRLAGLKLRQSLEEPQPW